MKKPKLLYTDITSLHSEWMLPLVLEYFDLEKYDPAQSYDHASTLIMVPRNCHNNLGLETTDTGLRFVIDNLWETFISAPGYVIQNKTWFWYNESLSYRWAQLHHYTPDKTYHKLALLAMRKARPHRTHLLEQLTTVQDQLIWSYVEQGRQLPNDVDMSGEHGQRHFDPAWYDQTYFSIVAETHVNHDPLHPVFITEKTFKPMAFRHPFVVYGNRYTLETLHELGFETFDNLFDPGYDTVADPVERGSAVAQAVRDFVLEPYSTLTQEKIAHNHAHFFDHALVKSRIREEILEPLLNHAETR